MRREGDEGSSFWDDAERMFRGEGVHLDRDEEGAYTGWITSWPWEGWAYDDDAGTLVLATGADVSLTVGVDALDLTPLFEQALALVAPLASHRRTDAALGLLRAVLDLQSIQLAAHEI